MPKREDETYRNIHPHPPYCTCWECTQRRLKASRDASLTAICPVCRKKSLFYNRNSGQYECLNLKCKATGRTLGEMRGYDRYMTPEETTRASQRYAGGQRPAGVTKTPFDPDHVGYYGGEYPCGSRTSGGFPGWLKSSVVIVLLMMFGAVVQGLWGSEIASFFSSTSSSPPIEVTKPPPGEAATPPKPPSGVEIPAIGDGISVFYNTRPPYNKTLGFEEEDRVRLINNEDAIDPTWQQLREVLFADTTDQGHYLPGFQVCSGFAEKVHNNAEAAGIIAAWVAVDFEDDSEGHALNAFNTVDRGLVFVDCTGLPPFPETQLSGSDKIAYVVVGKQYGLISLDVAISPEYSFYETHLAKLEEYESKLEAYNQEAEAYNQALGGRVYLEEPEYSRFMAWKNRLDSMAAELDALLQELGSFYWEPLGVVSKIEIYW